MSPAIPVPDVIRFWLVGRSSVRLDFASCFSRGKRLATGHRTRSSMRWDGLLAPLHRGASVVLRHESSPFQRLAISPSTARRWELISVAFSISIAERYPIDECSLQSVFVESVHSGEPRGLELDGGPERAVELHALGLVKSDDRTGQEVFVRGRARCRRTYRCGRRNSGARRRSDSYSQVLVLHGLSIQPDADIRELRRNQKGVDGDSSPTPSPLPVYFSRSVPVRSSSRRTSRIRSKCASRRSWWTSE